jgi:outer membrane protein assembly factor BamA
MTAPSTRASPVLLVPLLLVILSLAPPVFANGFADSTLTRFYGTVVDSVTISGNHDTKSHVILREMQTQPGDVLEEMVIRRDFRFIRDLSPLADVHMHADSLSPGHTAVRIRVEERRGIFLKSILPFLKYNFETGLTYGFRWADKNFRGRLEQLNLTMTRNQREDNFASFGWSTGWLGWKHISLGAQMSYFNRGEIPAEITVLERTAFSLFVGLPLTQSRMKFSQLRGSLTFDKTINGSFFEESFKERNISPAVGYSFDSRDSHIRPRRGWIFAFNLGATYPTEGESRDPFYRWHNNIRWFVPMSRKSTLALLSDVVYQFGAFPDYLLVRLGGARTLRGHPEARFSGYHRWFQTIEWRYQYLPRKVFTVPFVRKVDVGLAFVTFLDGGIVWNRASDFDEESYHATAGFGIRFYNPIRDVLRLDFGFNMRGAARFHWGTGIRF